MKKSTIERILKVTVILTIIGGIIFQSIGVNIFSQEGLVKIPSIISAIVLFWIFYFSLGWKLPLLKLLIYQENINGTWFGEYTSRDFTSDKRYKGEVAVVIRQSFLRIDIKSFTTNYINYSFGEAFTYDAKSDSNQLVYLYSQNQFYPNDDTMRKGTSELMLHCNVKGKELFGDFWTNHNSKGSLNLKKVKSKHAKSFLEAKQFIK